MTLRKPATIEAAGLSGWIHEGARTARPRRDGPKFFQHTRTGRSRSFRRFLLCVWLLAGAQGRAETNQAYKAAWKSLQVCASLITTQDMKEFGFHSTNELSLAQLAEPFPVYDLSLAQLRKWQPTQDLSRVFTKAETLLFPVTVTQDVRVSISMTKEFWGWKPAEFGGSALVRLYALERQRSAQATKLPFSNYFCARAPALHAYFIGYPATNGFMLISVVNDAELQLEANRPAPASVVLPRLARAARRLGPVLR
jgi:hypothetical protein